MISARQHDEQQLPQGLTRTVCPDCDIYYCPSYLPDHQRHRLWHERIVIRRSAFGALLLSPDQQVTARIKAANILADSAGLDERVEALLLLMRVFFSYSVLDKSDAEWGDHPEFEPYVYWFLECKKDFFVNNLRDLDGELLHRELTRRLAEEGLDGIRR